MKYLHLILVLLLALFGTQASAQDVPSPGTLSFTILDGHGDPMPGKLVFLKDGERVGVGVPYAGGPTAAYEATVYTASGSGTVGLPPGAYEVWAGRGLEYSADVHQLTIHPDDTTFLTARLRREVQTPGFISADMHVHVEHVAHLEERVISILGEGLDWAVSTEHNVHVDYAPAVEKLGVGEGLLTTVGNEVTTAIGHFNIFPVDPTAPPVDHRLMDAKELFARIRSASPQGIIQVNHPRWDGGAYFTYMGVSPSSGLTSESVYDGDFDSYELLNENRGYGWTAEPPDNSYSVRDDWYNLLNRGIRAPVFGNSDSHTVSGMLVGVPRNYVASSTDDPSSASESELLESIRAGRVTISRGLYVEAEANGGGVGDMVTMQDGAVHLRLRVQAPGWIDCRTINVVANGSVIASLAPTSRERVRIDTVLTFRPTSDTWYVVTAESDVPMRPLVHDAPVPITPLGLSNAIWVDVDGDGRFTSVYEEVVADVDRLRTDPTGLTDYLDEHPLRRGFAVGYVTHRDENGSVALFDAVLPHASSHDRPTIYRRLAKLDSPEGWDVLERVAKESASESERAAAALELVKAGHRAYVPQLLEHARGMDSQALKNLDFSWLDGGVPVATWQVVGPFPFSEADGLDVETAVERDHDLRSFYVADGKTLAWRPVRASRGTVDLVSVFGPHAGVNAYAYAEFRSASSGDVLFLLGSDDGVVLWLNGEEVHRNDAHRGVNVGDDVLVLRVSEGSNTIMMKIENGSGEWGFGLEMVDLLDVLNP